LWQRFIVKARSAYRHVVNGNITEKQHISRIATLLGEIEALSRDATEVSLPVLMQTRASLERPVASCSIAGTARRTRRTKATLNLMSMATCWSGCTTISGRGAAHRRDRRG